jgi:hypothetical protein
MALPLSRGAWSSGITTVQLPVGAEAILIDIPIAIIVKPVANTIVWRGIHILSVAFHNRAVPAANPQSKTHAISNALDTARIQFWEIFVGSAITVIVQAVTNVIGGRA